MRRDRGLADPARPVHKMRDTPLRLRSRRRWGQNFLVNQGAADTIVTAFRPRPDDRVLEVGPGHGALTRRLAGRVRNLVALEVDPALVPVLRRELEGNQGLEVLEGDVLTVDLRSLLRRIGATPDEPARVIANLPYNIATAVILRLLEERAVLRDLLVLVQREVAQRIASAPGRKTYGGLSVLCQARARVEMLLTLRPGSFRPIPKVESELIRLTLSGPRDEWARAGGALSPGRLEALLRVAFAQRRKTLLNNLARLPGPRGAPLGPTEAERLIRRAGVEPGARPEEIPVAGFITLAREWPAV
ncbi:MAG: ribosomal RNA small subunit methyltransferase A [Acidobacteria bacterium]|nr:MAG: ribosomal RNA small subunit methyltransferase A [Acidobacteriota bacterium]